MGLNQRKTFKNCVNMCFWPISKHLVLKSKQGFRTHLDRNLYFTDQIKSKQIFRRFLESFHNTSRVNRESFRYSSRILRKYFNDINGALRESLRNHDNSSAIFRKSYGSSSKILRGTFENS